MKKLLFALLLLATACEKNTDGGSEDTALKGNIVIAHRGTTYWAPEESEAAMRWARNMGADYLEIDLQMTKDGVLIALHDDNLTRTTDIAEKFPERKNNSVNSFTYSELLTLDIGTWFNEEVKGTVRERESFVNQDILTLEDVIMIASGYRIKRDSYPSGKRVTEIKDGRIQTKYEPDPYDNKNRPGVYPETKEPHLFPGIEKALKEELMKFKWYADSARDLLNILTYEGKVSIANTPQRIILQTFSKPSLTNLNSIFADYVPICFLLWLDPNDTSGASMTEKKEYEEWVTFGCANGATIIGPSIAGEPNNYEDLLEPWMSEIIKNNKLATHAYSFDTKEQMNKYSPPSNNIVDGWFTNRSELTLRYISEKGIRPIKFEIQDPAKVLNELGY